MKKTYQYYQPNKLDIKDKYGDCVIRALSKAMNKDWITVFDDLSVYSRLYQCMPNNPKSYETYMKDNGFEYHGISNKKGSKRPTVIDFTESHEQGTYVLILANHLVTTSEGAYHDTWNCGYKCLYGYWEKK